MRNERSQLNNSLANNIDSVFKTQTSIAQNHEIHEPLCVNVSSLNTRIKPHQAIFFRDFKHCLITIFQISAATARIHRLFTGNL